MGHRDLSCYCYWPQVCSCSDLKYFELKVMKNTGKDENENRTEILSAEKRKGISVPTTKPGLKSVILTSVTIYWVTGAW